MFMTLQNRLNLTQINQQELQNIRHIVDSHQMMAAKLSDYSQRCQDPQIKQMFQQASQSAQTTVQNLLQSL